MTVIELKNNEVMNDFEYQLLPYVRAFPHEAESMKGASATVWTVSAQTYSRSLSDVIHYTAVFWLVVFAEDALQAFGVAGAFVYFVF